MSTIADRAAGQRREPTVRRIRSRPWFRVLVVYLVSRAYSSVLLWGMFAIATAAGWPFASRRSHPTFFTYSGSWDAWFYRSIAERGYPTALPLDGSGHVLQNPWAFLPVFPGLERALTAVSGLTTYTAGTVIAVAAGAGAAAVLERLLASNVGERRALWSVAIFTLGPLGFLLQVAYAESLFLLLLFAALLAMQRGRYLAVVPLGVVAAFTRPGALVIPVAIAVQLLVRWRRDRRFPPEGRRMVIAAAAVGVAGLAWPIVADLVTGRAGTYVDTELSWWTGWVGRPGLVPFTPWFLISGRWLGAPGIGLVLMVVLGTAFWLLRRSPRALGSTVRAYSVAYVLYLLAVFLPQFSLPRLLMPLAPLLGSATFTGSRARRRVWLIAAAALQPAAVVLLWFLSYP